MAAYKLLIKPSAVKELAEVDKRFRPRIVKRIEALSNAPRPAGSEKLSGDEKYRVRQGPYRIVYAIDDRARTVLIVKIGQRREVYR